MGTINTFIFTTGDGRIQPLPVTLDAVLAMTREQSLALCNFMDPSGEYEPWHLIEDAETWEAGTERDMLTAFVIYHTLFVAIEVARDTETGIVQEPWTDKDVEAQLLWCADRGWDFVQECIQEECFYGGAA